MGGARQAGGAMSNWGSEIIGGSDKAGALGIGQFKAGRYGYDESRFQDDAELNKMKRDMGGSARKASKREGPEAGRTKIAGGKQAQFRGGQRSLAQALEEQAAGRGPSLAESQLQRATDANINQSMALAASQRGATAGQGLRQIAQQTQDAQQAAGRDAAELRIQEQLNARNQLGSVLQSGRAQDQSMAFNQANLDQQRNLANQQAELQQGQMNDAMTRFYTQGKMGLTQYDLNRGMTLEQLKGQQYQSAQGLNQAGYESASNRRAGFGSGLMSGFGTMSSMSDEEKKSNITEAKPNVIKEIVEQENQTQTKAPEQASPLEREITGQGPQQSLSSDAPFMADTSGGGETGGTDTSVPAQAVQDQQGQVSSGDPQKELGFNIGQAIQKAVMAAASDVNTKTNIMPINSKPAAISTGKAWMPREGSKGGDGGGGMNFSDISSIMDLFGSGEGAGMAEGAGAAASAMSDKNDKQDVEQPDDDRIARFIDALKAYEYEYKDPNMPGAGEGRFVSPMAQDIEKTPLGKNMVEDTPNGKMVNYGKAGGLMLATAAMLNDRMGELEQAFANRKKG